MRHAAADEDSLWTQVVAKARNRMIWAEERLRLRAKQEADEMHRILVAQKDAIDRELARRAKAMDATQAKREAAMAQLGWEWRADEADQKAQHDADTKHIEKRARDVTQEIEEEPSRVRALYEVKYSRLERVGLVYLWPSAS